MSFFYWLTNMMSSTLYGFIVAIVVAVALAKWLKPSNPPKDAAFLLPPYKMVWWWRLLEDLAQMIETLTGYTIFRVQPSYLLRETVKNMHCEVIGPKQTLIEEGFRYYFNTIAERPLSLLGRLVASNEMICMAKTRRHVAEYVLEHPDVRDVRMKRPLIIVGLPRTGSTMLYSLMASDSSLWTPRLWEMLSSIGNPTPSAPASERLAQTEVWSGRLATLSSDMANKINASHPILPNNPEEDLVPMMHSGCLHLSLGLTGEGSFFEWFKRESSAEAYYEYHRLYMQMLQYDRERCEEPLLGPQAAHGKGWLWKAPIHSLYLETLLRYHPDADIVVTHRDPKTVIPSFAKLLLHFAGSRFKPWTLDQREMARMSLDLALQSVQRMMALLQDEDKMQRMFPNVKVHHVFYEDVMKDPLGQVAQVYDAFDRDLSTDAQKAMHAWLDSNPQGKHGRNAYGLAEFGLDGDSIDAQFASYTSWANGIHQSRQTTSH